ncbi:MAG: dTMP kinase [Clostridiales bacterium]|nr:dTMP kinase [Clostridiales bacterium]
MKGKFVTFEGCEGVGKSTQLQFLKDYLKRTGQSAVFTREPGGTEISEQIRAVIMSSKNTAMSPVTEALLYAASRMQLVEEVIAPALKRGELVICDRYIDSSVAYQGGARNLGSDFIKILNKPSTDRCMPDLTVFIDLEPKQSFRMVKKQDRIEQEGDEFHYKVYKAYLEEIRLAPERFVTIEPCQDKFATHEKILKALRERGIIR